MMFNLLQYLNMILERCWTEDNAYKYCMKAIQEIVNKGQKMGNVV